MLIVVICHVTPLLLALPPVPGVQGIVEAYRMVLPQLKFSGPTNFSPIINHVASIASSSAQSNAASVRTRPEPSDTFRTRESHLPVSCSSTTSSSSSPTGRSPTSTRPATPSFGPPCCRCPSSSWGWGRRTLRPWSSWMETTVSLGPRWGRLSPGTSSSLSPSGSSKT